LNTQKIFFYFSLFYFSKQKISWLCPLRIMQSGLELFFSREQNKKKKMGGILALAYFL